MRTLRHFWSSLFILLVVSGFAQTDPSMPANTPDSMILVEGGTFNIGKSEVTLSSFYLDKYELTQYKYYMVMQKNPSTYLNRHLADNHPVENVTWFDAIEFCNRLSIAEGLSPCYSLPDFGKDPNTWPKGWSKKTNKGALVTCDWTANGYRLPTEAEWEYAARGGKASQGYKFSGSNTISEIGYFDPSGNSPMGASSGPINIATKKPNELGFYDMSGNVTEWCWDFYGSLPSTAQQDPHGKEKGSNKVVRGGGWPSPFKYFKNDCRAMYPPDNSSGGVNGFRIARNAS